jgi:hypothetical protein
LIPLDTLIFLAHQVRSIPKIHGLIQGRILEVVVAVAEGVEVEVALVWEEARLVRMILVLKLGG